MKDHERYTRNIKPVRVLPREKKFVEEFLTNGGNATQAYLASHPTTHSVRHANKMGWISLQRPKIQALIKQAEEEILAQGSPSVNKLVQIRDKGETEKLQLEAAKTLLDTYVGYRTHLEKTQEARGTTTNILIADLSDSDLAERIARALSGTVEAELQERPSTPDGGDTGVQESGSDSQGGSPDANQGGDREEERTFSAPSWPSEINPDNDSVRAAEGAL